MQIVIDIPKEVFNEIVSADDASHLSRVFLKGGYLYFKETLQNGTPLPKGHGRIGDLDVLKRNMIGGIKAANFEEGYADYVHINNVDDCVDCVRYADAIIEADKEESEDKE